MTFFESLLREWLPSSRVAVQVLPNGQIKAQVLYSEKDWLFYTTDDERRVVGMAREFIPKRRVRRRLHWGKRH